ncbi:MAG TPA: thioesterase family protein [Candidatus Dormibacteraeota bacterium]|jgi:acyl-CoA thioester hydrolase
MTADPLHYSERWRVRNHELDSNGHVNNSVYLAWAEEIATRHAEAAGYGRAWSEERGGGWVIHRTEITYHRPAVYNDVVEVVVDVELIRGARGIRSTRITRSHDDELLAELWTEWAWVRLTDGRPMRVPPELAELAAPATARTLALKDISRKAGARSER